MSASMIRTTRPRSRRSRDRRSMGGGKRTWSVLRSFFCSAEMALSGLEGSSLTLL